MGAKRIINNRKKKNFESEGDHNIEGAMKNQRFTHGHNLISEWPGVAGEEELFNNSKKALTQQGYEKEKNWSAIRFLVGSIKYRRMSCLYKVKHNCTMQTSTPMLRYCPSEIKKNLDSCKTCTWKVTEALFTITKYWKQPKGPLTGTLINRQCKLQNKRAQESQTHNAEKPDWEGDILYKSLTVTSLKEKKTNRTIETRADQWLPGIGMGKELKLEGVSTGEFFEKWDFLYFDCAIK